MYDKLSGRSSPHYLKYMYILSVLFQFDLFGFVIFNIRYSNGQMFFYPIYQLSI